MSYSLVNAALLFKEHSSYFEKKKATDQEKKEGFLPISAQINWYITA